MSATAERYGVRPSELLGIPPTDEWRWAAFCLDEALHFKHGQHEQKQLREMREQAARERAEDGDATSGRSSYASLRNDERMGRPPSSDELKMLPIIEAT